MHGSLNHNTDNSGGSDVSNNEMKNFAPVRSHVAGNDVTQTVKIQKATIQKNTNMKILSECM